MTLEEIKNYLEEHVNENTYDCLYQLFENPNFTKDNVKELFGVEINIFSYNLANLEDNLTKLGYIDQDDIYSDHQDLDITEGEFELRRILTEFLIKKSIHDAAATLAYSVPCDWGYKYFIENDDNYMEAYICDLIYWIDKLIEKK